MGAAWPGLAWLGFRNFHLDSQIYLTLVRIGFETHTTLELGRRACAFVQVGSAPPGLTLKHTPLSMADRAACPPKQRSTAHVPKATSACPQHHYTHKCDKASWLDPMFFIRQRMFCFGAPFTTTTARLHNRLSATNTVVSPSQVSARKGARSTRCHTGASARRRMQRRQDDLALCNYGFIRLRWHTNLQVFAAHVGNSLSDAPARRARCVTKSTAAIGCEA